MSGLDVPALVMGGWYDLYADDMFTAWAELRASGSAAAAGSRLVVGPWPHALSASTMTGGSTSERDRCSTSRAWSTAGSTAGSATIAERRRATRRRCGSSSWARTSGGTSASGPWPGRTGSVAPPLGRRRGEHAPGDGSLSRDGARVRRAGRHVQSIDPDYPVPTTGGRNCCWPDVVPWGPYDQRDVEMRADVLCYTSDAADQPIWR